MADIPIYHSGTGLLLAGLAVCAVGLLVFCCIDMFWLKKDLKPSSDNWTQLTSDHSQTSSM